MNKMIGENTLTAFLLATSLFLLTACGGENVEEIDTNEPLKTSFSSKPTDKQVLSFLKKKGRYDIKLSDNAGNFSTYQLRKRWQKGFSYKTNAKIAEFPDAELKVGGFVRFEVNGENYDFAAIKPLTTQIFGLPLPKESKMIELVTKDITQLFPSYRDFVVFEPVISIPSDDEAKEVFWYSPDSFKINMQTKYAQKIGNNRVDTKQCLKVIRFYRENLNSPFNRFIDESEKCQTIDSKNYSYAELQKLPNLQAIKTEKQAKGAFSQLEDISIPNFKDEKEALGWVYKFLINAENKDSVKSMLMHMLTADAFVKGSTVQLNGNGTRIVNNVNSSLFDGKVTFKESHCPQIFVKKYSPGYLQFYDALKQTASRLRLTKSGGTRVRGKMQNQSYKIATIELYNPNSDRDIENLKSWLLDELCEETAKKVKLF